MWTQLVARLLRDEHIQGSMGQSSTTGERTATRHIRHPVSISPTLDRVMSPWHRLCTPRPRRAHLAGPCRYSQRPQDSAPNRPWVHQHGLARARGRSMPTAVTRRRFLFQTLGVIGGTMVTGDLLPLLAAAAQRKQVLRVAIERDIETLRPEISSGDTVNLVRRLIYTTPSSGARNTARMARSSTIQTASRRCSPPPIGCPKIGS